MPPIVTTLLSIVTCTAMVLRCASVVIMPLAASSLPFTDRALTALAIPAFILSISRGRPISPVEDTITF